MQDQIAIAGMKQAMAGIKQQAALAKQLASIQSATAEAQAQHGEIQKAIEDMLSQADAMDKALDRQVEQYKAESSRITADAAMLKVVGELAKPPDPPTPKPGGSLP
jgi:chromosome segregation ATPase